MLAVLSLFRSTRAVIRALVAFSVLALLFVISISAGSLTHMSREEDREVLDGFALIEQAFQLRHEADLEVLFLRGTLIKGQITPGQLYAVHNQYRAFRTTLAGMREIATRNDDLALLERITTDAHLYEASADHVMTEVAHGDLKSARADYHAQVEAINRDWNDRLNLLIRYEERFIDSRHEEINSTEDQSRLYLMLAGMLTVPVTLLLARLVARRVLLPLGHLEEASIAIARGQLEVRVPQATSDEMNRVSSAFNLMAGRVADSLNSLQGANTELQRLDRHKDEFLSTVSHELKTPLNFIQGFASLLANQFAGPLSDEQRMCAENILTGTERMRHLVSDLLDVAMIRAGKLRLEPEPLGLATVVTEVLMSLQPLAAEKHQQLEAGVEGTPEVLADHVRITQVLTNLIANAIKFTPEGGTIHVDVAREAEAVRVAVRDTGIGIAPEEQGRLFQPFTQVDMSSTRRAGGTGLGLSICKALVEAHGGVIGFTSEPGAGSTFWFSLPFADQAAKVLEVL